MAYILSQMVVYTKEFDKMGNLMGMEYTNAKTRSSMKVNLKMDKNMEREGS